MQRVDVVRAIVSFIQQPNLRIRSISAYRISSSGGGSPQGVRSLQRATSPPRALSVGSPKCVISPEGAKGAGAAQAVENAGVPSPSAKAPGSSRAGKGKRVRVESVSYTHLTLPTIYSV